MAEQQHLSSEAGLRPATYYCLTAPATYPGGAAALLHRRSAWRHWRLFLVLLLLAGPFCYAIFAGSNPSAPTPRAISRPLQQARPIGSPFAKEALRPLSSDAAQAWNESTPLSGAVNPAAAAFLLPLTSMTDYQRSVQCMTMAIYYEAGNEPTEGERAVAQVVLNRLRHPVYPKTVCGVIFEGASRKTGCQFTFACDGSMARTPNAASWRRAEMVATAALAGYVYEPVGMATHYHANYVVPYWAATLDKVATLGAHIFYRWNGRGGLPQAFVGRYAGKEPALDFLSAAVTAPEPVATPAKPMIVSAVDRPVIATTAAPARSAAARAPEAVSLEQRWIVPRGEMAEPTAPPSLPYAAVQ